MIFTDIINALKEIEKEAPECKAFDEKYTYDFVGQLRWRGLVSVWYNIEKQQLEYQLTPLGRLYLKRGSNTTMIITVAAVLRKWMERENLTQQTLANAMKVSRYTINQLCNGRRGITADMAIRLAIAMGTTPETWLRLQAREELHKARERHGKVYTKLRPVISYMTMVTKQ